MAISNGYVALSELKSYIGLSGSGQDTNLENAIEGASRLIDKVCGRKFWIDGSVISKLYTPIHDVYVIVDDIATATGLVVKTDDNDDGTHETTLTINTDFILLPSNPEYIGTSDSTDYYAPQNEIRILTSRSNKRFDTKIMQNIKVEAKFGFAIVPDAIKQATLIQALRFFKRKDTPFNVFGNEQTGQQELFNKIDPDAMQLIKGFVKHKL
tara:strand:+ start:7509 stop:8141 length:633 start_codon:yes stop_codon:yes gene_type:complete